MLPEVRPKSVCRGFDAGSIAREMVRRKLLCRLYPTWGLFRLISLGATGKDASPLGIGMA
jgi:hypothetical protein